MNNEIRFLTRDTIRRLCVPSFLFLFASLALNLGYRILLRFEAVSAHASKELPGVFRMLVNGFAGDFLVSLALTSLFFLSVLIFIERRKLITASAASLLGIQALALVVHLGYFEIFEKPFSPEILGADLGTFWREILTSAVYETSVRIYLLLFAAIAAITGGIFFLSRKIDRDPLYLVPETRKEITIPSVFLAFCALLFISSLALRGTASYASPRLPAGFSAIDSNPVVLLGGALFSVRADERSVSAKDLSDPEEFRFGLDTTSPATSKIYPRVRVPRGRPLNVLFYFFESTAQRYVGMKYKGVPVTPTWDRLRKNAFVAGNHYANFPLTVNSLVTILSSTYDHPGKKWVTNACPDMQVKTVFEVLKERGYRTGFIHTGTLNIFYHRRYLKNRGLDLTLEYKHLQNPAYKNVMTQFVEDRAMIPPAEKFMAADKTKPFFLALCPIMPHHPYSLPDERYRITSPEDSGKPLSRKEKIWLDYINSLHYSDAMLGEVIKILEKNGQLENTLVFVIADHGEAFYQHPNNYLHALFLYEENVHVPFLIYNEKLFRGGISYSGISSHIDIAPTLLDILDISKPREYEGVSLLSPHRQRYASLHAYWEDDYMGIRDGNWKYILRMKDRSEELFDLSADGDELKNVAKTHPGKAEQYRRLILRSKKYREGFYKKINCL